MAQRSYRQTLQGENNRLMRIKDEIELSAQHIGQYDHLAASYLDWAIVHLSSALRELAHLIRIAQHEETRRSGK